MPTYKLSLIGLFILFGGSLTQAQSIIPYNFKEKHCEVDAVKHGSLYNLKLEQINTLRYTIDINADDIQYSSTPPSRFLELQKDKSTPAKHPNYTQLLIASLNTGKKEKQLIYELANPTVEEAIRTENKTQLLHQYSEEELAQLLQMLTSVSLLENSIELSNSLAQIKLRAIAICLNDYESQTAAMADMAALLKQIPAQPEDRGTALVLANERYLRTKQLIRSNDSTKTLFQTALFKEHDQLITEAFNQQIIFLSEGKLGDLYDDLYWLESLIKEPNTYTVISPAKPAKKDYLQYQVNIASTPNTENKTEAYQFQIKLPTSGGLKVTFSAGLSITGGLYNGTVENSSSNNPENRYGVVSISAFSHFQKRSLKNIVPAFSVGLGINAYNFPYPHYYFGPSLLFGKEKQFAFSTGIALSRMEVYSDPDGEGLLPNAPTQRIMKMGGFVAFTYSLPL